MRQYNWRSGLATTVALIVSLALGSAAQAQQADGPIKIGFLTVQTGSFAPIGIDMLRGAQLRIKEVGSINGRPLKLYVEDTEGKPAVALRKADRLVNQEGVQLLLGVFSSGEMVALAGAADKLGVPIVATNPASSRITGELCNDFVFRTNANDDQFTRAAAEWIKGDERARNGRWYILGHDYEWGHSSGKSFKTGIMESMGVKLVGEDYAPLDTKDWSTFINKIQAAKADYVWSPIIVSVVTDFIKQARSFGMLDQTKVLAMAGITDTQLQAVGQVADGVFTATWSTWTYDNPNMKKFNEAYWKEYKTIPAFQAITTYAGTGLALDGIARAASTGPKDLVAGLEQASFAGPYGTLTMRKEDHQAKTPAFIGQVGHAPENKFGAKWAVQVIKVAGQEVTTIPLAETGCARR